ncbi:MAG: glycosyltransferase family 87 protein [Candidatus Hydrogenedentota bacterium]
MESLYSQIQSELKEKEVIYLLFLLFIFSLISSFFIPLYYGITQDKYTKPLGFGYMPVDPRPGGDYLANYIAGLTLLDSYIVRSVQFEQNFNLTTLRQKSSNRSLVGGTTTLDSYNIYINNRDKGEKYYDIYADECYYLKERSRFVGTPLLAYVFIPFAFLSFKTAYYLWTLISLLLLIVSIYFISQLTRFKFMSFISLFVLYFQSHFLIFHLERGQTDILVLLFIVLFIYFYLLKNNKYLTALFFTLAFMLKLYPGIFIFFFLIRKEFKILIMALILSIIIIILTGLNNWYYYIFNVLPVFSGCVPDSWVNHSLLYFLKLFSLNKTALLNLYKIISAFMISAYVVIVIKNKNRDKLILLELVILNIVMDILPSCSYNYKLVSLIFLYLSPFVFLDTKIEIFKKRFIYFVMPVFLLLLLVIPVNIKEYIPCNVAIMDRSVVIALIYLLIYFVIIYVLTSHQLFTGQFFVSGN